MAGVTTALVGLGVMQAGWRIADAHASSREAQERAEYNAMVYEGQAEMVESQKSLEAYQYDRQIHKMRGAAVARTAGAGLMLSGSPLAMMIDNETQLLLDKAIGQYNLEVRKRYALSGAREYRRQGRVSSRLALYSGYTNAFTSLLSAGDIYARRAR